MGELLQKDELVVRTNPPPESSPHHLRAALVIAAILLGVAALLGAARAGWIYLQTEFGGPREAAQFLENRARLSELLSQLPNVPGEQLARGFWYTYTDAHGTEHVLYFDINQFAQANLSEADLRALADTIGQSRITARDNIRQLTEEELPSDLQFHNQLYSFGTAGVTSRDMEAALRARVASGEANTDDLFRLAYIFELQGKYTERDELNRENCARFGERCGGAFTIMLSGRVVDGGDAPIQGAVVEIASRPDVAAVETATDGTYAFEVAAQGMEKLRVRALKRNYSDGFQDVILLSEGRETYEVPDIDLSSPITIVTIDPTRRTVTGAGNSVRADGTSVLTTSQSQYEIPANAIVDAQGRPYAGPIDVYLYEFSKGNVPESLTELDTFDDVVGYAGDLMKTFGMPYIQFFAQDGEELHVLKSNPMILTYRIADMEALRTNQDQIYRALTNDDMELLVLTSKGREYAIDRQFLINNHMLHFPAFWVFDRRRGVWDNVGITVLDTDGTIRSPFYTMRDDL